MIYLILSAGFKDNNPDQFEKRLKIGYTNSLDDRLRAYLTTNPDIILLQTREGDTSVETYLHRKFEKYRYKDSREWFYYSQEIIDHFQDELEDFIDEEILLDCIRKSLRSGITPVSDLKEKYLNQILDEIKSRDDFEEELYDEEIFSRIIVDTWSWGVDYFNKVIDNTELVNYRPVDLLKISDPEITVDITLDLPQILGRQRLLENPWKNRAELYFKTIIKKNIITKEDFENYIKSKLSKTESLLSAYNTAVGSKVKHDLAETYQKVARSYNYKDDYVAVNTHGGKDLFPVRNELVLISERRAFDIQQIDYSDRFTVFNKLSESGMVNSDIIKFVLSFNSLPTFYDKMKALCESSFNENERMMILEQVPLSYKNMYLKVGPARLKANGYNITSANKEFNDSIINKEIDLGSELIKYFIVGQRYSLVDIKEKLKFIFNSVGYKATPKASILENYFEVKKIKVTSSDGLKKDHGYEILKKKA